MNDDKPDRGAPETSLSTLMPPTKPELGDAIAARIRALFGGIDEDYDHKLDDHLEMLRNRIRDIVESYYQFYPEIDILEILDEQVERWKKQHPPDVFSAKIAASPVGFGLLIADFISRWFEGSLEKAFESYRREKWSPQEALDTLRSCRDYPFDEELDLGLLRRAARRLPEVNIITQVEKKVNWWNEHPEALKAAKPARTQLWEWFVSEYRYLNRG
jgi:hypothetical protein